MFTIVGLVLLMVLCLAGIVAIIMTTDLWSWICFGSEACQGLLKIVGLCILAILQVIADNKG